MSIEKSDAANRQRSIDEKQRKLDAHDGKADGTIEHPNAPENNEEEKDKLTNVYIGKVNDLQGRILDARRTVDIGKNARSPNWQQVEQVCDEAESGLLERLAALDEKTMHEVVDTFDKDLTTLIDNLKAGSTEQKEQAPTRGAEEKVLADMLGLPPDEAQIRVQSAIEHYGREGLRRVLTNMSTTARVPASVHEELFGCPPIPTQGAERATVALLIANGNLEKSPHSYLLENPSDRIRAVREAARDRVGRVQANIETANSEINTLMKRLVDETKGLQYGWKDGLNDYLRFGINNNTLWLASGYIEQLLPDRFTAAESTIQAIVNQIKALRPKAQRLSAEQQGVATVLQTLEIALATGDADAARLAGRTEESDRRMILLLEQYGEDLGVMDPVLGKQAMDAAVRLRDEGKLSDVEKAMLFSDVHSPDALKAAVEQKLSESGTVDILDQVRAKQTFRAGSFEKFEKNKIYYEGRDVSGALRIGSETTLTYTNGKSFKVIATPQAQRVLENIPQGLEPVLLRPVRSIKFKREGPGRYARQILGCSPHDCIINNTDLGFVDRDGNIVRDDLRTPIDLSQDEHRGFIEAQTRNQKGFRLAGYSSKFPLRTLDGKPYPYKLYTLKTQSGITAEGITLAKDAIGLINTEPPDGKTLVLKRIPRPINLRAPDSERYGRQMRQYQCVLQADIITKKDLAYAHIENNVLHSSDLNGKDHPSVSVADAQKEQEEKTRDIARVIDRHPGIHGVNQVASTVQQTVGHLEQFLQASQEGSAREAFVQFAREEAKPTLALLNDPKLQENILSAKTALRALKGINGVALGGLEQKIDEQMKALDGFTAMLSDGRTQNLLQTIMDASKFDADTWANFCTNELPVIVASIVAACAAAALVIATMGGAAPLIAVSAGTLTLATAGATAAGAIIGAELAKDAVHWGHHRFDSRVKSGDATYTDRSRLGKWREGQKKFNDETGQEENLDFLTDVANPLAREFAIGFATTLATMGIGNAAGAQLGKLLQNSTMVERLTARSDIMKTVVRKLAQLNTHGQTAEQAKNLKQALGFALKSLPKDVMEEFSDEVQEDVLEQLLEQIDIALVGADAVDGKLGLATVTGVLLAIAKNVKVGKSTVHYDVPGGPSPASIASRAKAIRTEAEGHGAIVTDLGHNALSIRYAVNTPDGAVTFERVNLLPPSGEVASTAASVDATAIQADEPVTDTLSNGDPSVLPESPHDLIGNAKASPAGRTAMLEYMKTHEVDDPTRLTMAKGLIGQVSPEQETAIILAHNTGEGNLVDGYSADDRQAKYNILADAGLSKTQIGLLMDTGIVGNASIARRNPSTPAGLAANPNRPRQGPPPPPIPRQRERDPAPRNTVLPAPPSPPIHLKTTPDTGQYPHIKAGATVNVRRSSGEVEQGWTIESREQCIVMQSSDGSHRTAVPTSKPEWRQDWEVKGYRAVGREPGCIVKDGKGSVRPCFLSELAEVNIEKPGEFMSSALVAIPSENGYFPEQGWRIQEQKPDGSFIVKKYDDQSGVWMTKEISANALKSQNFSNETFAAQGRHPFRVGEEVYVIRPSSGVPEKGWRINVDVNGKWIAEKIAPGSMKGEMLVITLDPTRVAHLYEVESNAEVSTMPKDKAFEFVRRMRQELDKNGSLNEAEFTALFRGELKQSNVGNCYLIAAFNSMKASPHFEAIMRTSVAVVSGGYEVKLPLGGADPRQVIFVENGDLQKQKVDKSKDGYGRTSLYPVQASIGWQVLEAAYIKYKRGSIDRAGIESGFGHQALLDLMGKGVDSHTIYSGSDQGSLSSLKKNKEVLSWLNTFHPGRDIATVSSLSPPPRKEVEGGKRVRTDSKMYPATAQGKVVDIYYGHAYSVTSVNRFGKPPTVTVRNPHNTGTPITFTFDEFSQAFKFVSSVRVDFNNMFPS